MNSKLTTALRILLALLLLLFGSNKFFNFLPTPTLAPDNFLVQIIGTGYLWSLIGLTEITASILLLFNKWKGFALVIIAPISVNIILYHINYDINGIAPGALVAILNVILIYANWSKYKSLF